MSRFNGFVDRLSARSEAVKMANVIPSLDIGLEPAVNEIRGTMMTKRILLTGRPGCGKTTLVKRVVNDMSSSEAGGFYTEEIRKRGERVGFKVVTLDGEEAVLAHVDFKTRQRVGKYGLDLSGLESIGIEAIRRGIRARQLVVIDEIGPMELRSGIFRDAVNETFDSDAPILATITARPFPFTEAIKKRRNVTLIEVRRDNREQLAPELAGHFTA
jgi:nucleoside-triphosphatase